MTALLVAIMLAMRATSTIVWVVVACTLVAPGLRAFSRNARRLDPVWAVFAGLAINRLWFIAHAASYGEPPVTLLEGAWLFAAYVFAITCGCGVLWLRRLYGDA